MGYQRSSAAKKCKQDELDEPLEVEESELEDTDVSADGSDLDDADITQKCVT